MDADDPNMQGNIAPPHHRAVRGVAAPPADRLDRPLPDPPPAVRHPDRRDAARARRPDPLRQGALHRQQHVRGVAAVESSCIAKELGLNRFVCEQPPYNLLDRRIERELLPMAQTYGMAIIPWSPLAGGLLTGKYQRGEEPPEGARFADQSNPIYRAPPQRPHLRRHRRPASRSPRRRAARCRSSRWRGCMQQPGVTSPIIGPRTMEQYDDNMKALDVEITDDDRKQINRVIRRGDSVAPFYEADFGPHQYRT